MWSYKSHVLVDNVAESVRLKRALLLQWGFTIILSVLATEDWCWYTRLDDIKIFKGSLVRQFIEYDFCNLFFPLLGQLAIECLQQKLELALKVCDMVLEPCYFNLLIRAGSLRRNLIPQLLLVLVGEWLSVSSLVTLESFLPFVNLLLWFEEILIWLSKLSSTLLRLLSLIAIACLIVVSLSSRR